MRTLVFLAASLLLPSCDGTTRFRAVPVEGLPSCEPVDGQLGVLQRPIVLEITHGKGKLTQTFSGADPTPVVSLAEGKDNLRIRVGRCEPVRPPSLPGAPMEITCKHPEWLAGTSEATVDPREPGAKLTVGVPGEHPCVY